MGSAWRPIARADPYRHGNQLPLQIEMQIVRLKQDKPSGLDRQGASVATYLGPTLTIP
jgi:hypothetical protein